MSAKLIILGLYLMVIVAIGFAARRKTDTGDAGYFLANRSLGILLLLATIAATNFSAFTIFGCSGEGYRNGLAFLPVMAFGTGFMALTFWLIGRRSWQLGKQHGLITPAELVATIYKNKWTALIFAAVMVIWTIPYLALQPLAGGMVLNQLFGIEQLWGAVIVTAVIVVYTLRGGLRAVVWTDAIQGLLMLTMMLIALGVVAANFGGLVPALEQAYEESPAMFSRPGLAGGYPIGIYFSMILLWFFCDPMFPQLFQRFMAAKSERALAWTMTAYPLVCTVVFTVSIIIGVLGQLSIPGLEGRASDNILPLLMDKHGGELLTALVLIAGLAALMSTMDSQLLTLSSIVRRDILPAIGIKTEKLKMASQLIVVLLALAGLAIAVNPPGNILKVGLLAFTGLAALFPTVLFGLHLKNPSPLAAVLSILTGQGILIAHATGAFSTQGYLPALSVIVVSLLVYIIVQIGSTHSFRIPKISKGSLVLAAACAALFILAMDFYNWNVSQPLWFGLPLWVWFSFGLSFIQTGLSAIFSWPQLKLRKF